MRVSWPLSLLLVTVCLQVSNALHFSPVFGDGMVLQRATAAYPDQSSAVYGSGATAGSAVSVTVSSNADVAQSVGAVVEADGTWKAFLKPQQQAGGSYTVTAQQAHC